MAKYIGDLVDEVRIDTENESYSENGADSYGIKTAVFLRQANYALQRLQSKITNQNVTLFRRSVDIPIVASQADYTIPDNVYLGESIVDVQYSSSGNDVDFNDIREVADSNRYFGTGAGVSGYSRRQGKIYLSPVPSATQGKLRVTYERTVDQLDLRRGQVTAVTIVAGVITLDTLTINIASDDPNRINEVTDKYLCVCDKDGNVLAYNIPYTSYDSTTGVFTHPAHTLATGETVPVDGYITVGKYTSTHITSVASPDLDRYVQIYTAMKILRIDSNVDSNLYSGELAAIEAELIENFASTSKDEHEIQIAQPDLLLFGRR